MADDNTRGTGYDLACLFCGSECRAIDKFCSQCGRADPTASDLTSPTLIAGADDEVETGEGAPTIVGGASSLSVGATDSTVVKGDRKARAKTGEVLKELLLPGNVFGRRYRIQRFLGAGAMGYVCSAIDESIDEVVALKILSSQIQEDPEGFERFKMELKLARRIRHRNVVQSFDLGFADGFPYISMEYIDADNLMKHLMRRERFEERSALMIVRQVLRGLRAAHDLGIIHRDIKPENILLNKDQMAFITDFGIATSGDLARRRELAGTPDYMAPEQLRCEPVSPASDLYSCGVLLYRMLTGQLPYRADSMIQIIEAHLYSSPEPVPDTLDVMPGTRQIIEWMLQKEIADRPQSAIDVLEELEPLLKTTTARSASQRVTALVIEHDPQALAAVRAALEQEGYRVYTATNARDGVTMAFEQNPAVIFLDARISGGYDLAFDQDPSFSALDASRSGMDGLGFFRIVRGDEKLREVPVIVMSEDTLANLKAAFTDSGAADVLLKPLSSGDVLDAARRARPVVAEQA